MGGMTGAGEEVVIFGIWFDEKVRLNVSLAVNPHLQVQKLHRPRLKTVLPFDLYGGMAAVQKMEKF